MSVADQAEALERFDAAHIGLSKGALSLVLIVNRGAATRNFPLRPAEFETPSGGQVAGLGGGAIRNILRDHGIVRTLSAEGGRTSRGNMERMRLYVDLLNSLHEQGSLDIKAAESFWIGKVVAYFDALPFTFKHDPAKSLRASIRDLLNQAVVRQREASGTMYAGAMMQHLVGAKLKMLAPDAFVSHGHAVADAPTNRSADFLVKDLAVHVTTAPTLALMEKCSRNLSSGLRAIIITTADGAGGARAVAVQSGLEDRIDVLEIEQFLAANIYERGFDAPTRAAFISTLLDHYNEIVKVAETDPSLRIEIDD